MVRGAETGTRTIVFTDAVESTALRSRIGDPAADVIRREHDALMRRAIESHHGLLAKSMGDGVMAVFESAAAAVECAVDMQERVQGYARRVELPVSVRIGVSAGDVAQEQDDWLGTPVIEAARLQAVAEPDQILVAEIVRLLAGTRTSLRFGPTQEFVLKGLPGSMRACPVRWGPEAATDPAPPDAPPAARSHLRMVPPPAPGLIGRDDDRADLAARLDGACRLVTLIGPGGVGKTRLAMAVADDAQADGRFPDGVHRVELAAVGPDQAVNAVASALDVREAPGLDLQQSLVEHLATGNALLVLDNCEHLVEAAATLVDALLTGAPRLVVLATSQAPLGTPDEIAYSVLPLSVPEEEDGADLDRLTESPAVQLFVERAQRSNRTFALTDATASAIVQICRKLDGIPLAIELAAARIRALSANQIADRLDDRFRLLTSGKRTDDERHQTLLAAVEWSYSLLSEAERRVLARVSSFPGGFDLEAAERVASDDAPDGVSGHEVFDLVATLVDKSLITTVERPGGDIRYRLLETIRSYANERLDDRDFERTSELVLHWAFDLAEAAEDEIDGPGEDEAFLRVSIERENLVAAIGLAEEGGEAAVAMTIAAVLAVWLDIVGQFGEGIALCEDVLGWTTDVEPITRRRLLLRAGNLALSSGRLDAAHTFYEESLQRARELDDDQGVLSALNNLSITAMWQGNLALARKLLGEAEVSRDTAPASYVIFQVTRAELAIYSNELDEARALLDEVAELHDSVGSYTIAEAAVLAATALYASGNIAESGPQFQDALGHAEAAEAMEFSAFARHGLGLVALDRGDLDAARDHLTTALGDARDAGHTRAVALLLASIGVLERVAGDAASARFRQRESLQLRVTMGDRYGIAQNLELEAALLLANGDAPAAVRLHGAAAALRVQTGAARWPVEERRVTAELESLRTLVGDEFDGLLAAGEAAVGGDRALAEIVRELFDEPEAGAA